MLKSIRGQAQQGVDPAKQTATERVADDMLNCLHPKIAGNGTQEGTAAHNCGFLSPSVEIFAH